MTFPTPPSGPPEPSWSAATPVAESPLWPDPPPEEPKGRIPEGLLLALVALFAGVVVLGGLVGWSRWRSDEAVVAADDTSVSTSLPEAEATQPPSTNAPPTSEDAPRDPSDNTQPTRPDDGQADDEQAEDIEHVACPADVPAKICDAAAFVETFRGRPFKEFPTVELIDGDAFGERLLRDFEEVRDEVDLQTEIWRSLGFIDSDVDLYDAYTQTFEVGVVGVYFTDTKELYIQGTELDLYAELTIVHELVHAHDDQWFDLFREEYDDAEDEVGSGFSAVVEGNARRVENAWRAQLSPDDRAELDALELTVLSPDEIRILLSLPSLLLELQFFPYQDGEVLVADIASRGGEDAVDAAIVDPPRTTEQVLHPELFSSGEPAVEVPTPPADGESIDESVVGELLFDLWFGDQVGDGWGGDATVSWRTASGGTCTRIDVVGDTDRDTDEFFDAADRWSREADGRSVERVDDLVRITGCY